MSSVFILAHRFFWNTKKIRIPTKVDATKTDDVFVLNKNDQEPGSINKDTDITDYQEPK